MLAAFFASEATRTTAYSAGIPATQPILLGTPAKPVPVHSDSPDL